MTLKFVQTRRFAKKVLEIIMAEKNGIQEKVITVFIKKPEKESYLVG